MTGFEKHLETYFENDLDDEDKELYSKYTYLNISIKKIDINIGITKFLMASSALILVKDSISTIINNSGPTITEIFCISSLIASNYLCEYFNQEKDTNINEKIAIYTKVRRKELACKTEEKDL